MKERPDIYFSQTSLYMNTNFIYQHYFITCYLFYLFSFQKCTAMKETNMVMEREVENMKLENERLSVENDKLERSVDK
jgi:hypothetical protein